MSIFPCLTAPDSGYLGLFSFFVLRSYLLIVCSERNDRRTFRHLPSLSVLFIGRIVCPFYGLLQFLLRLIDMAHRRSAVPAELGFFFVIGFGHGLLGLLEQIMRLVQVRMVFPIHGVSVARQQQ